MSTAAMASDAFIESFRGVTVNHRDEPHCDCWAAGRLERRNMATLAQVRFAGRSRTRRMSRGATFWQLMRPAVAESAFCGPIARNHGTFVLVRCASDLVIVRRHC